MAAAAVGAAAAPGAVIPTPPKLMWSATDPAIAAGIAYADLSADHLVRFNENAGRDPWLKAILPDLPWIVDPHNNDFQALPIQVIIGLFTPHGDGLENDAAYWDKLIVRDYEDLESLSDIYDRIQSSWTGWGLTVSALADDLEFLELLFQLMPVDLTVPPPDAQIFDGDNGLQLGPWPTAAQRNATGAEVSWIFHLCPRMFKKYGLAGRVEMARLLTMFGKHGNVADRTGPASRVVRVASMIYEFAVDMRDGTPQRVAATTKRNPERLASAIVEWLVRSALKMDLLRTEWLDGDQEEEFRGRAVFYSGTHEQQISWLSQHFYDHIKNVVPLTIIFCQGNRIPVSEDFAIFEAGLKELAPEIKPYSMDAPAEFGQVIKNMVVAYQNPPSPLSASFIMRELIKAEKSKKSRDKKSSTDGSLGTSIDPVISLPPLKVGSAAHLDEVDKAVNNPIFQNTSVEIRKLKTAYERLAKAFDEIRKNPSELFVIFQFLWSLDVPAYPGDPLWPLLESDRKELYNYLGRRCANGLGKSEKELRDEFEIPEGILMQKSKKVEANTLRAFLDGSQEWKEFDFWNILGYDLEVHIKGSAVKEDFQKLLRRSSSHAVTALTQLRKQVSIWFSSLGMAEDHSTHSVKAFLQTEIEAFQDVHPSFLDDQVTNFLSRWGTVLNRAQLVHLKAARGSLEERWENTVLHTVRHSRVLKEVKLEVKVRSNMAMHERIMKGYTRGLSDIAAAGRKAMEKDSGKESADKAKTGKSGDELTPLKNLAKSRQDKYHSLVDDLKFSKTAALKAVNMSKKPMQAFIQKYKKEHGLGTRKDRDGGGNNRSDRDGGRDRDRRDTDRGRDRNRDRPIDRRPPAAPPGRSGADRGNYRGAGGGANRVNNRYQPRGGSRLPTGGGRVIPRIRPSFGDDFRRSREREGDDRRERDRSRDRSRDRDRASPDRGRGRDRDGDGRSPRNDADDSRQASGFNRDPDSNGQSNSNRDGGGSRSEGSRTSGARRQGMGYGGRISGQKRTLSSLDSQSKMTDRSSDKTTSFSADGRSRPKTFGDILKPAGSTSRDQPFWQPPVSR